VSNMPGLKTRLLKELEALVQIRGWNPVNSYGKASARHEERVRTRRDDAETRKQEGEDDFPETLDPTASLPPIPASRQEQEEDTIDTKLAHLAIRNGAPPTCSIGGTIRGVETLGAWAGASLVAQQRIKGIVEIDRDRYLQHGLQGASREKEVSVVAQRQSMGPNIIKGAGGERASWTLGVWA
jgi:hypothetical protein